ncbi:MAG TPA: hypothetical protein VFL98_04020 [Candidatus Paceibacterota bacterium]|nr:hypothetical protein [Candidatus Paceibacterota bacterium]
MQNSELERFKWRGRGIHKLPNRYLSHIRILNWQDLPAEEIRLLKEVEEKLGPASNAAASFREWLCGQRPRMPITDGERSFITEIARENGWSLFNEQTFAAMNAR